MRSSRGIKPEAPLGPRHGNRDIREARSAQDSGCPRRSAMAWTTPILVEICIGLEINGYLPAEF